MGPARGDLCRISSAGARRLCRCNGALSRGLGAAARCRKRWRGAKAAPGATPAVKGGLTCGSGAGGAPAGADGLPVPHFAPRRRAALAVGKEACEARGERGAWRAFTREGALPGVRGVCMRKLVRGLRRLAPRGKRLSRPEKRGLGDAGALEAFIEPLFLTVFPNSNQAAVEQTVLP